MCKPAVKCNASPHYGLYFPDHEISYLDVTYSKCYSQGGMKATEKCITFHKFYHHTCKEQTQREYHLMITYVTDALFLFAICIKGALTQILDIFMLLP